MNRSTARRMCAATAVLLVAGVLSGCTSDTLADRYAASEEQGYVAGDGSWQEFAPAERAAPVAYGGTTSDGNTISSDEFAGDVVVVNFWYSACPPCRAEAEDLEKVHQNYTAQRVHFVGVNVYDQAETINSFNSEFGVTYPSIIDVNDAEVRLAFADNVPPQAIPSTLVLDREGRVAAVIRGVADPSVLGAMIDRVLEENAS